MMKLCRRTIILAALGLVYNSVPALLYDRPIRFPGVLQRIALSSFVNSAQPFWAVVFPFIAIAIWWYFTIAFYDPTCPVQEGIDKWFLPANCTAQTRIDVFTFGERHMYTPNYDPEGLLSTLTTAAVTVCAGTSN
jgi:predicted acyltransferase